MGAGCDRREFLRQMATGAMFFLLNGCAKVTQQTCLSPVPSVRGDAAPAVKQPSQLVKPATEAVNFAVHEVAPFETIPRLAQMYGVAEAELRKANQLKPGEALTPGRQLLIPHPSRYRNIVPVYPNDRWQYIIVHHTAGEFGKALTVDQLHRERGFDEGLGYHFLVDNGSLGKGNGQLEVAPRWIKQEQGAHCKASNMNLNGIGIGLVGNFNDRPPSRAQLHTLMTLVVLLGGYYKIGPCNVLGHRQVPEAKTDCPGHLFPWDKFKFGLTKAMA